MRDTPDTPEGEEAPGRDGSRIEDSQSVEGLIDHVRQLRRQREVVKARGKAEGNKRRPLTPAQRDEVLRKTDAKCHVCGGAITDTRWNADHVRAHSGGGSSLVDNFLPAHGVCNNYRWDYLPEEFQLILQLGVYARTAIEEGGALGVSLAELLLMKEQRRRARRRS